VSSLVDLIPCHCAALLPARQSASWVGGPWAVGPYELYCTMVLYPLSLCPMRLRSSDFVRDLRDRW
jgi:hypothetical protein